MAAIFTMSIIQRALELGCIYALIAIALYISFTLLNIADLSTDGCFTLGCAVGAMVTMAGHPILAFFMAMGAGVCSGFVTAFLQTKMGVQSILAGIIVNTGLYTINLAVMGFSSNINLYGCDTLFSIAKNVSENKVYRDWYEFGIVFAVVLAVCLVLAWFLNTSLGLSIRATGDNEHMVKASSINPGRMVTVGLCISGSLTALSGAILGQYQKSCDINFGTGQVTIALASLVIGGTLIHKGGMFKRILGVVFGSCLYRFIAALALRLSLPTEAMKLVSAVIVAAAISFPYLKEKAGFIKKRSGMRKTAAGGGTGE
ncbi:MAG: ABC transporter permease [Lachnospiraceae bacterium]|nr:ABC transporter permease [Lachnospiraceae bacterium]